MDICFLGTSAGRPTLARNVTSIALLLPDPGRGFWLFDAGEGTQHRLLQAKLKLNKLERIFITHMHGDHLYGLPGLLSSRTFFDGAGRLELCGPPGLRDYVEAAMTHSGLHLNYELTISEAAEGPVVENDPDYTVEAAELRHRIRCFGYRVAERPKPGKLDLAALARLGVPPGPAYGKLKRGEDLELPDGRKVRAADVIGPPAHGRIVTILGDTSPCDAAIRLARDADLLVHEATFAPGLEEKAIAYGHSTMTQAAEAAARACARRLAVTHFSARYSEEEVERLVDEARGTFPEMIAARDGLALHVGTRRISD